MSYLVLCFTGFSLEVSKYYFFERVNFVCLMRYFVVFVIFSLEVDGKFGDFSKRFVGFIRFELSCGCGGGVGRGLRCSFF